MQLGSSLAATDAVLSDAAISIAGPALGPTVAISHTVEDERRAAGELVGLMRSEGMHRPFVIASRHGGGIIERLRGVVGVAVPGRTVTQSGARSWATTARRAGADAVVAVGGGRCLDVGKLTAAAAGLPLVVVPTQLAHDGICSPVAVLPRRPGGVAESLQAVAPRLAFFSMPTLLRSPPAALRAGIGDLLSNPFALSDWRLAAEAGLEPVDERAYAASMASYELVEPLLARPLAGEDTLAVVTVLARALAWSGLAMFLAGTSRPASGAEHKISHAIDATFGPRAHHGAQVAFACLLAAPLHGLDVASYARTLARLDLPHHPHHLGLSASDLVRAVLRAPQTRPGRFTILEQAALDKAGAAALVRWVWPDA